MSLEIWWVGQSAHWWIYWRPPLASRIYLWHPTKTHHNLCIEKKPDPCLGSLLIVATPCPIVCEWVMSRSEWFLSHNRCDVSEGLCVWVMSRSDWVMSHRGWMSHVTWRVSHVLFWVNESRHIVSESCPIMGVWPSHREWVKSQSEWVATRWWEIALTKSRSISISVYIYTNIYIYVYTYTHSYVYKHIRICI